MRTGNLVHKIRGRIEWASVIWEKQDAVIAREIGCTRERVRQKRRELGIGQPAMFYRHIRSARTVIEGMTTNGKTLNEIAKEIGVSISYAKVCLERAKKSYLLINQRKILKYDWKMADWTMTDTQISKVLGVKHISTVTHYRTRHRIPKRSGESEIEKINRPRTVLASRGRQIITS